MRQMVTRQKPDDPNGWIVDFLPEKNIENMTRAEMSDELTRIKQAWRQCQLIKISKEHKTFSPSTLSAEEKALKELSARGELLFNTMRQIDNRCKEK